MQRRLTAIGLGLAAALALGACSSTGPTASSVISSTTAALENAGSVRFVDVSRSGAGAVTLTGALSGSASEESSTTSAGVQLEVRMVDGVLYLRSASAVWLSSVLGVPAASASAQVGRWISITSTDSHYAGIAASLSIPAAVSVYLPSAAKASVGSTRNLDGHEVIPIASRVTAAKGAHQDTALFVSSSSYLPVGGTITVVANNTTATKQAIFRAWNQPVSVEVPPDATSLSVLG